MTSKYLSSFLPVERYARLRLPCGGSLGPHFPTFPVFTPTLGTMLRYDCHFPVSVSCAFARPPIPCLFLVFVSFLQARQRSGTLALTPGLLGHPVRLFREVYKEANGSPKFPGYPFEFMPCSQTPVVSSILALSYPGLLPSAPITASAFPPKIWRLSFAKLWFAGPRLYKFRGSITRPALLLTLASDFRYRTYPQGSLLICWLDFD